VTSQMASLRKLVYMTCGDWHTAEDAVANALVKLYPRWRGLDRPDLYAKTMVYRAAIDETRRPWRRERAAGDAMPDVAQRDPVGAIDERQRIRAALHAVPPANGPRGPVGHGEAVHLHFPGVRRGQVPGAGPVGLDPRNPTDSGNKELAWEYTDKAWTRTCCAGDRA
jgi:hypothetical protein